MNILKQVNTKLLVIVSAIIILLSSAGVFIYGFRTNKTLFENSIILISILSVLLFLFLTIGLFHGIKLKDDIGKIKRNKSSSNNSLLSSIDLGSPHIDASGIGELIVSLIMWLILSIIIAILFWVAGEIFWILFTIIAGSLYWVFYRALRLVFLKSGICRDNLLKSSAYGFLYTFLYTSWIYLVVFSIHYFKTH